ncbi:acyl--binding domain-containing protein 6-like [Plasmopara halstedii]|uniref:Acyl--binding domain-containing protein 6-like n=1 Tax=Plasmopara halstedii TaxID=4781 RepID=A0A0P1AIP5_PLAHL|nr:acyl--binding domain-containing protein 6-like [Plasmopara halstedii]CEG40729.1 acyl--binding domain-containing protein 6-like [Plasmopara halstedii]|eukprot:XP_024577098.1 acyl--binding domain-containing protein 6-like [Plasmopara halstedii]
MTSQIDVAVAMNTETAGDSLMVSSGAANKQAQEIDSEDQTVLQPAADDVDFVRQERCSLQTAKHNATNALQATVANADQSMERIAHVNLDGDCSSVKRESPKSVNNEEQVMEEEEDAKKRAGFQTTPSKSKQSEEFFRAVYRADKYKIREMLEDNVVDVNVADQHGWSGLHWAASQNHGEMLNYLLQKGAEVNGVDEINGWTALHVAIVREAVSCVNILLSSGADPSIRDKYNDTVIECLQAASKKNKRKMLQLLHEARSK